VVLLHGFPQDGGCWDAVVPRLHAAGLRTLVPDQRGYSPGARPGGRAAYRMPALVDDVVALLEDRGLERAHVVGHDWGGAVAWAFAAWEPARTTSLTVLSTPHPAAMVSALRGRQALASWYMAAFQLPVLPEVVLPRVLPRLLRSSGLPHEVAERYARRLGGVDARRAALDWYRAIPFSGRQVGDVDVPTTYVWGERDPALLRRAADLTERHVRADYRLEVLTAGHWLPETRPAEVAAAVVGRVRGSGTQDEGQHARQGDADRRDEGHPPAP
jgi:pimeloyl-ACP methyl ester carboxylesterase